MNVPGSSTPLSSPVPDQPASANAAAARGLSLRISREHLATLPLRHYTGPIVIVQDQGTLDRAAADLQAERLVGFDTEKRPSFHKGQSFPPSLVQFATDRAAYLFPLRNPIGHRLIADILGSRNAIKVGIAIGRDALELQAIFPFTPHHLLDLGVIAQRWGLEQSGARNLTGLFLNFRLSKGARTTNWSRSPLTQAQITYAATDAWVSRELYLRFKELDLLDPPPPPPRAPRPKRVADQPNAPK